MEDVWCKLKQPGVHRLTLDYIHQSLESEQHRLILYMIKRFSQKPKVMIVGDLDAPRIDFDYLHTSFQGCFDLYLFI